MKTTPNSDAALESQPTKAIESVENYADLGVSEGGFNEYREFFDNRAPI